MRQRTERAAAAAALPQSHGLGLRHSHRLRPQGLNAPTRHSRHCISAIGKTWRREDLLRWRPALPPWPTYREQAQGCGRNRRSGKSGSGDSRGASSMNNKWAYQCHMMGHGLLVCRIRHEFMKLINYRPQLVSREKKRCIA